MFQICGDVEAVGFPVQNVYKMTYGDENATFESRCKRDLACGGVVFFIFLDVVDETMNGSSYAQCATPQYFKTVQFSSVNLEP